MNQVSRIPSANRFPTGTSPKLRKRQGSHKLYVFIQAFKRQLVTRHQFRTTRFVLFIRTSLHTMAEQPMTPSRFLNLKRSLSREDPTKNMADLSLPDAVKKTDDKPSPILKGTEKNQSPGLPAQKGMITTFSVLLWRFYLKYPALISPWICRY